MGLKEGSKNLKEKSLADDLRDVINKHSADNEANTPDFILAQYLLQCLNAFSSAVARRDTWFDRRRPST